MPRDLAELRREAQFLEGSRDAIVAVVPFELSGRAIVPNISLEERLVESIDRAASAAGQSRSAFLAEAVRRRPKGKA